MPWCPECKAEYKEGIEVCADCGVKLVDVLSSDKEEDIPFEDVVFPAEDGDSEDTDASSNEYFSFDEEPSEQEKPSYHHVYINNEEKAEDNRTSAYTLLAVGVVGFVLVSLFFFGVIPSNFTSSSKYMISGIMGALFILFIIMGIVALKNFISYRAKAGTENNLTNEILNWSRGYFTKESIDRECNISEEDNGNEELCYFSREEYIEKKIKDKFINLNEDYVGRVAEEIYSEIYG